jgi:hypothetical protein
MIYPSDEQIKVSNSVHSIAVSRDVSTPGYSFPNASILSYQKPFLAAGLQGKLGCLGCSMLGDIQPTPLNLGDWILIGGLAVLVLPHFFKS